MTDFETLLITGANSGLGKEAARQLAHLPSMKRIYLGCRNQQKADAARLELEAATGKAVFEFVEVDTTKLGTVSSCVEQIEGPVDGVILNAGGMGGPNPTELTRDGVTCCFAANVLGHAALVETLIEAQKVRGTVVYVGSEASRGIPGNVARPELTSESVEAFEAIANGSIFAKHKAIEVYGWTKYMGSLWTSSMARRHPQIRFVTVSPGATTGTNGTRHIGALQRFLLTQIAMPMMSLLGHAHGVEEGAKRYVSVLTDDQYRSGGVYGSPWPSTSGALVEQSTFFEDFSNEQRQDHAHEAVSRLLAHRGEAR